MAYAHFLEDRSGKDAVFNFCSNGQDHSVAIGDASGLELGRVRRVSDDGEGNVILDTVDVALRFVDRQDLES
jgi:hypothetical protein